jgi:uncharacterized protein (DUF1015 family)
MATLRPFRALRPRPDLAARVASVPYDVVDTAEARQLAVGNPVSFLHVIRPEIDLPPEVDVHAPEVYAQGAAALRRLVDDGVLLRDREPGLFLYRQVMDGQAQTGMMGCVTVDEYDRDLIKKHEKTRPDKEDDRVRHILTSAAHAEPVFLTYAGRPEIDALVAATSASPPLYDFTAADGVQHTVWQVAAPAPLTAAFAAVPALYVADGHHRCAAASRAAAARRAAGAGEGEHDAFLAVLFPAGQLRILPYNRVVHDLGGLTPPAFLSRLRAVAEVRDGGPTPGGRGRFAMYLDGRWYEVAAPAERLADPDPVAALDAAILQSLVLAPLLGIDDPRTATRIDFVGGIRGSGELVKRVQARGDGVAFALHPVSLEQLMAVADAGAVLPPKSTWFEPKLRSGLAVHEL